MPHLRALILFGLGTFVHVLARDASGDDSLPASNRHEDPGESERSSARWGDILLNLMRAEETDERKYAYVERLGKSVSTNVVAALREFTNARHPPHVRLRAWCELLRHNQPDAPAAAISAWRDLALTRPSPPGVLMSRLSPDGQDALLRVISELWPRFDVPAKHETLHFLGAHFATPEKPEPPERPLAPDCERIRAQAISLLLGALSDNAACAPPAPCLGQSPLLDSRICDIAVYALHQIAPQHFPFFTSLDLWPRELHVAALINQDRVTRGLEPIPLPGASRPELPPESSLRITQLRLWPSEADVETALRERLTALLGSPLRTDTLPGILAWYADGNSQGIRSLSMEASRTDDLRGVTLVVVVEPGTPPEPVRFWNYSQCLSFAGKPHDSCSGTKVGQPGQAPCDWRSGNEPCADGLSGPARAPFRLYSRLRAADG